MKLTPLSTSFGPSTHSAAVTIAMVLRGYDANRRAARANTKTRGDVSGGGRKPWKQKGTGRARAGSTRSPLWRKGGTVFGPHSTRNYRLTLPAALRTRALGLVLAERASTQAILSIDSLPTDGKTKALTPLTAERGQTLLILEVPAAQITRAGRNLQSLTVKLAAQVNAEDVLRATRVVGTDAALSILAARVNVTLKSETTTLKKRSSAKKDGE